MSKRRAARAAGRKGPTVADVLAAVDSIAPLADACDWDNVGLLAGRRDWPAASWLAAIDLTDAVAREALRRKVGGLLVYHPPIFKGIRAVTPAAAGPTNLLADLLAARVAIISTHTALDVADGGTNDVLLSPFDITAARPLLPEADDARQYKLVVFVPPSEVDTLRAALSAAGAGVIGAYHDCSFMLGGKGTFRGDETTNPVIGQRSRLETVDEVRLEMVVPAERKADVVQAVFAAHSYEEPAFDLYPLHTLRGRGRVGLGRVGTLRRRTRGRRLIQQLGKLVDLSCATVVGDPRRSFGSVTTAAGAFGVEAFRDPDSLVITGEFKHHDALALLRRGICAVCVGHYASERPALEALAQRLRRAVPGLSIRPARTDRAPLSRIHERA